MNHFVRNTCRCANSHGILGANSLCSYPCRYNADYGPQVAATPTCGSGKEYFHSSVYMNLGNFKFPPIYEASLLLVLLNISFSSIKILLSAEAIIITGGEDTAGTSVEVILSNSTLCTLPPMPEWRHDHSQSGLTACGGHGSPTVVDTCTTLSGGAWATSQNLNPRRMNHVSWNSPSGLMLLGGHYSKRTTALLSTTSSSSSAQFELLYDTE